MKLLKEDIDMETIYYYDLDIDIVTDRYKDGDIKYYTKTIDWEYEVPKSEVMDVIYDLIQDQIDENDMINGIDIDTYLKNNYDDLVDKYNNEIKEYFREDAEQDAYNSYEE